MPRGVPRLIPIGVAESGSAARQLAVKICDIRIRKVLYMLGVLDERARREAFCFRPFLASKRSEGHGRPYRRLCEQKNLLAEHSSNSSFVAPVNMQLLSISRRGTGSSFLGLATVQRVQCKESLPDLPPQSYS